MVCQHFHETIKPYKHDHHAYPVQCHMVTMYFARAPLLPIPSILKYRNWNFELVKLKHANTKTKIKVHQWMNSNDFTSNASTHYFLFFFFFDIIKTSTHWSIVCGGTVFRDWKGGKGRKLQKLWNIVCIAKLVKFVRSFSPFWNQLIFI